MGLDDDAQQAALGRTLQRLLLASYGLPPHHLAHEVAGAVGHLGATDVVLLLADYDQELLVAFDADDDRRHQIDGPGPGLAFRQEQVVEDPLADGRRRLWIPTKDSAERLGVLGIVDDGWVSHDRWEAVGSLVGELIVSKAAYGDHITLRRRTTEFSLAAEMRWGLLPPLTYTSSDVVISGIVQPPHGIAGDAFDYSVSGGTASLAILDAMGHGLEASRMANVAVASYRNSRRRAVDPVSTLLELDTVIASEFGDARFVTAQVAELDLATGRMEIANAGHPPPLLLSPDQPPESLACPPARPAGLDTEPGHLTLRLDEGQSVLFRSDGIVEARSPSGAPFGDDRLAAEITRHLEAGLTPAEILRATMRTVVGHKAERTGDDATLLLVRRPPRPAGG